MITSGSVAVAVAVALAAVFGVGLSGDPVIARVDAANRLELSHDGSRWSEAIDGSLLTDALPAPGMESTGAMYVRNGSSATAAVHVSIIDVAGHADLLAAVELRLTLILGTDVVASAATSLGEVAAGREVVVADDVATSGLRRIEVGITLAAEATNDLQAQPLRFDLLVEMAGDETILPALPPTHAPVTSPSPEPAPPTTARPPGPTRSLSDTGTRLTRPLMMVGATTLVVGLVIATGARRRR